MSHTYIRNCEKNIYLSLRHNRCVVTRLCAIMLDVVFYGLGCLGIYVLLMQKLNFPLELALYSLWGGFYFLLVPFLYQGTWGQTICGLRMINMTDSQASLRSYFYHLLILHTPMILWLCFEWLLPATYARFQVQSFILSSYFMWLGVCVLSWILNPNRIGIHDKIARISFIKVHCRQ